MLLTHYWKAFHGYLIWKYVDRKCHAPLYILMPKEKEEYNYHALLYLEQYLESRKLEEAVILTCDEEAIASLGLFVSKCAVEAVYVSRRKALKLIKYFALNISAARLVIVSLTEPYDTHSENLLGINGVDKGDLVWNDIYRLKGIPEKILKRYDGNDRKIRAFVNRVEPGDRSI